MADDRSDDRHHGRSHGGGRGRQHGQDSQRHDSRGGRGETPGRHLQQGGRHPQHRDRDSQPRGRDSGRRAPRANLPRTLAWEVLRDVEVNDAYANLLLPSKLARTHLNGLDAGLATELTYGTLRGIGFYDAVIDAAAQRPAAEIDPPVLAALRMGAHQLLSMRVADHAAVSETVGVIKAHHEQRVGGFVNAVLRRISERSRDEWVELVVGDADEARRLEITTSHPGWIIRALRQALVAHGRSAEELPQLLDADNTPAAVCLSVLPGLADREAVAADWGTPTPLSPLGVHLDHGSPLEVPEVRAGTARVQDEGSQLVALALTAVEAPAGAWLDMCAGPGGKTAVLGARARQTGDRVIAADVSDHRADLVEDSTRQLADVVEVFTADGREFGHQHAEQFSRVLVDAPCSGLGALRRRPEARWRRRPSDVNELGPVQRELLASAIAAVMPGGVVAYTTCSPHHAETLLVVEDALRAAGIGVELLDAAAVLAEIAGREAEHFASAEVAGGRCAQLWPDVHGTDGMFLALLRKKPTDDADPAQHAGASQHAGAGEGTDTGEAAGPGQDAGAGEDVGSAS
ncbi:transcription antitermination factor NusB [Brevibacterium daeguense]|uniref:Transcription antitermination factor NusB n=1 Tax=Brevibacterium daeguense TaxID=909936 RepID=A0ABP8EN85_9MICO|nr:transcription antitermination factor NusB [Brevibacterium daeguense]